MAVNVFDLFKIGIGPSSSHTVGPMRAAGFFVRDLEKSGQLPALVRLQTDLYGSLGATGKGHGSDLAVLMGFLGEHPDTIDPDSVPVKLAQIREQQKIHVLGQYEIDFDEPVDLILHKRKALPYHANGMRFIALDAQGEVLHEAVYFSVGGGFVVNENAIAGEDPLHVADDLVLAHPFSTGEQLLEICQQHQLSISDVMLANEAAWRSEAETREQLHQIWTVMQSCVERGMREHGTLPGGMKVQRRAAEMLARLQKAGDDAKKDPLHIMDWVNLYAIAANEENAAGGRVVTAPTNGAAGIIPAVMHYYYNFVAQDDEAMMRFLLTAGAIGLLFKENASISGAEVGCQGEVGSACAMAAGALCEILGGTPAQVENAAEIGMEHNLGLTCDPIGGLVQVPCIERNAMAAVKAINAARMALQGDGEHFVSLDKVIKTMKETGRDMQEKYKETARGGLAIHVVEVPVSVVEC